MPSRPSLPFNLVIDSYIKRNPKGLAGAYKAFLEAVQPFEDEFDEQTEDMLHALFLEWFVFDFKLEGDTTPLGSFIINAPASVAPEELDGLRQSLQTHFTSTFHVTGAHSALGMVTMEDLATGKNYTVQDASLSKTLPKEGGLLGARLVNVNGKWYFPGNPVFFYPMVPTDNLLKIMRETASKDCSFIDLVIERYGSVNNDEEQFDVAETPQSPEERKKLLQRLKTDYEKLTEEYKLTVTWENIVEAIRTEDGEINPEQLMRNLFANESGEVAIDSMEALNDLAFIFMNAWNNLPHDSIGGKCPSEM